MHNDIIEIKTNQSDDFKVEYSVISSLNIVLSDNDLNSLRAKQGIDAVNIEYEICKRKEAELNNDINRLTNSADGLDYIVAVTSGLIVGLIDSFFVGEFSIENAQNWGTEKVNSFVEKIARSKGYEGDDLAGAVKFLEDEYPITADKATAAFGGGLQHHLRDFSHHPTPIGLVFSLLTQFTKRVYGTDVHGVFKTEKVTDMTYIGKDMPQKIMFGVIYWCFHMVSDIAGSSGTVRKGGYGTGLPGPLVSFLKEISALPIFSQKDENGHKEFSVWISKLFNGTLLGKRDTNGKVIQPIQFDLRTEIGVIHEVGKQIMPVLINECVVRGFYSIRRFIQEVKTKNISNVRDLEKIEIHNILPIKNRTIVRMLTISSGTFVAVDAADAAIRSAIKSGGNWALFATNFVLHINFVGSGRFAVAVVTDISMGVKKSIKQSERIALYNQMLKYTSAKLFYRQAEIGSILRSNAKQEEQMWEMLEENEKSYQKMSALLDETAKSLMINIEENKNNLEEIGLMLPDIERNNPGLTKELLEIL